MRSAQANAPLMNRKKLGQRIYEDRWYLLFLLPAIALLFLFSYMPMYGLAIAFQDYKLGAPLIAFDGSTKWVGLDNFVNFFKSVFFNRTFGNTVRLSMKVLVFGFWVSPVVAILLNEAKNMAFKRTVQTMYYMPYFVSLAIVVSILTLLTGAAGPIGRLPELFGGKAVNMMNSPAYFDSLYTISEIWKGFGYASILYLAAIAGVDPNLYEAVAIDGGNRMHKIIHVTVPYILPTFAILLILQIGNLLNTSTEKILLMYNAKTMDVADVIGTYIYRVGLKDAKYSYTAAIGLFANVINFVLVFGANRLSRFLTGSSLW